MITRDAAIAIAYDWHAGQDSSLYAFASTNGRVQSESHRGGLTNEINSAIPLSANAEDRQELINLRKYVDQAPILADVDDFDRQKMAENHADWLQLMRERKA